MDGCASILGDEKLSSHAIRKHILYTVLGLAKARSGMKGGEYTYLIESSHRLVRTSDLNLSEVCFAVVALLFSAVDFCLVDVLPTVGASQYIFDLLALHIFAVVEALVEDHLVWTSATFEAVHVCEVLFVQW